MWKYILKRISYFIPTILAISILVFTLVRLIPGDPVEIILGQRVTAELAEIFRTQLGLDQPIYVQYFIWLRNMLTGYWGRSLISGLDVNYLIFHRFRYTLTLSIFSMAIEIGVGLLLGIIAAYKAGSRLDRGLRFITIFGWSLPSFLVGIVLIYIFTLQLRWFPPLGAGDISHLILPGLTLAVGGITYISRMTRGSMLEVAGQDFVRTAKAKGLKKRRIMLKHVMRNALLPIVTMLGISFGGSLSGAFIVETIFSYPGIGYLAVQSVSTRDYAVVQGCVIFIAFIYCTTNLVVDILYAYLDPRVRYERRV